MAKKVQEVKKAETEVKNWNQVDFSKITNINSCYEALGTGTLNKEKRSQCLQAVTRLSSDSDIRIIQAELRSQEEKDSDRVNEISRDAQKKLKPFLDEYAPELINIKTRRLHKTGDREGQEVSSWNTFTVSGTYKRPDGKNEYAVIMLSLSNNRIDRQELKRMREEQARIEAEESFRKTLSDADKKRQEMIELAFAEAK